MQVFVRVSNGRQWNNWKVLILFSCLANIWGYTKLDWPSSAMICLMLVSSLEMPLSMRYMSSTLRWKCVEMRCGTAPTCSSLAAPRSWRCRWCYYASAASSPCCRPCWCSDCHWSERVRTWHKSPTLHLLYILEYFDFPKCAILGLIHILSGLR